MYIYSLEASSTKVLAPSDYTCAVKLTCTCQDCEELKEFLQNCNAKWKRFTVTKKLREHILQQMSWAIVTFVVETVTKPHSLVLIKIKDTYEETVEKQQNELTVLASLRPLLLSEPPAIKKRVGNGTSIVHRKSKVKVHHT